MDVILDDIVDQTSQLIKSDDDLSKLHDCERSIVEQCRADKDVIKMGTMICEPVRKPLKPAF